MARESPASPPPLPGVPAPAPKRGNRHRNAFILAAGLAGLGVLVWLGSLFIQLFPRELTLTESQKACVVTAGDAARQVGFEVDPSGESWDCSKFYDGSRSVYYFYEDWTDEEVMIDCTLTIERNLVDAVAAYGLDWSGLKVTNRFAEDAITLEPADQVFRWGDQSNFAFQVAGGERQGFAFVARKGTKVFFLDCWGLVLEDPEGVAGFLSPHLERFATEEF